MNTSSTGHDIGHITGAVAGLLAILLTAGAPVKTGDSLPEMKDSMFDRTVPETKGKVVLLDFWASWCVPCRKSFPELDKIYADFKDKGLVLIGICIDEKAADKDKFLAKYPVTFPIIHDKEQKYVAGIVVDAMPTSFLVDAKGKIRFIHQGFHGKETVDELRKNIETLFKEKQ
jgi:thiol-disulfide isomerase/thioredoxin